MLDFLVVGVGLVMPVFVGLFWYIGIPCSLVITIFFLVLVRPFYTKKELGIIFVLFFCGTLCLVGGLSGCYFFKDGLGPGFVRSTGGLAFKRMVEASTVLIVPSSILYTTLLAYLYKKMRKVKMKAPSHGEAGD